MPDPCVISGINAATMVPGGAPYGLLEQAAIVVTNGVVDWVGPLADLPAGFHDLEQTRYDGRLVTPALIDCHTHIVHGGNRAREFELRLNGASYEEVARAGGGIASTVQATRAASPDALLASTLTRVDALIAQGVAMVEVKSGYGLDLETEMKMLRVARRIEGVRPIRVRTSFLGAHAVPDGTDPDHYIDKVCLPALEACHAEGLVDAVDGFCEGIAFDTAQIARVFDKARDLGLPVKSARRTAEPYWRRGTGGSIWRDLGRSCGICDACGCRRAGQGWHGCSPAAGRVLHDPRNPGATCRGVPGLRCCDGCGDGLEPRIVATGITSAGDEHGLHPVPSDA